MLNENVNYEFLNKLAFLCLKNQTQEIIYSGFDEDDADEEDVWKIHFLKGSQRQSKPQKVNPVSLEKKLFKKSQFRSSVCREQTNRFISLSV